MGFTKKSTGRVILGFLTAMSLSACGGNGGGVIQGASGRVYTVSGDQWVETRVEVSLGSGTSLPAVSIPIRPGGQELGVVSLGSNLNGGGFLALAVNLTELLRLPPGTAMLPNGLPIPLGGMGSVPLIAIPVGGAGSQVYAAYGDAVAMLGAAVVIPALAPVGAEVGTTAILPAFRFGAVNGIGGIFTSSTAGKNGFSVFMNIRGLLPASPGGIQKASASHRFKEIMPSSSRRIRALRELDRLDSQGAVLRAR